MNCAFCGTPRNKNENTCSFCGVEFSEVNIEQEINNYTDDVVTFDELFEEKTSDSEAKLQHDSNEINLDEVLSDIEELNNNFFEGLDLDEIKINEVEEESFGFSLDDLDDIEKILDEDTTSIVDFEEVEESKKEEKVEIEEESFNFSLDDLDDIEKILDEDTTSKVDFEEAEEPKQEEYLTLDDIQQIEEAVSGGISVEPLVEEIVFEQRMENENLNDNGFDFSLDDLDDIEQNLMSKNKSASNTLSLLEEALLSGEDVTNFDVKEAFITEEKQKEEFFEESEVKSIANTIKSESSGYVSVAVFEKIRDALIAKENGETVSYIVESDDERDDDEILAEIQRNIDTLMKEQVANEDNFSEELLELEQMLLSQSTEDEDVEHVIEDVEDIEDFEDLDFVDVEDIDDEDNFVKLSDDEKIQSKLDSIVQTYREKKEGEEQDEEDVQEEGINVLDELRSLNKGEADEDSDEIDLEEVDMEALSEIDQIDQEILKATEKKIQSEARAAKMARIDNTIEELDSLISEVVGDIPTLEDKVDKEEEETKTEAPTPEEVVEEIEKTLYDTELVKEYEALRLDLELFFPGTQDLDNLDDDINELLNEDDMTELIESMELDTGIGFEGFEFEELTDRDISDALLDIRDTQDREERKKLEERRKKRNKRKEKINSILTLGNRVKVYDTAIILVCLITATCLGIAWASTITTRNLSVNMQTRSEKLETAEELWASLHDISTKFDAIQISLDGYIKGEIETNKISFELSNFIEESVTTRQKFETVDLPTYSVYKYRIDEFIAKRMLLAEEVLQDIENNKISTDAMTEFLELDTDFDSFEDVKDDFYKQLNLNS